MAKDDRDSVKRKNVLMVHSAPTLYFKGCVSNDFGTAALTRALEKFCLFFDVPFEDLFDTPKMKCISIQVNLLSNDHAYKICRKLGRLSSEYDVFTKQHVADMVKPGFHGHVLCSNIQFYIWT